MGIFFNKAPECPEPVLSYEFLCNALTKWHGEAAFFAHVIYLDDLATSFISEVVQWKVCVMFSNGQTYTELMLKFYPRNKTRAKSFRSADFFKNEIAFYEQVLPELLEFQNSKEVYERFENHLKLCFSYCDGKNDMICFGDARIEGFDKARPTTIDIDHGKLILKTLARFHALSFAIKTQKPEKYEALTNIISETYYSEQFWSWYKKLWSQICFVAIDAVEKELPDSIYVKKIKEFAAPRRFKDLIKAVKVKENSVILHGDCRKSNYLFKYTDERPVDIKMVDFQQTRRGSPVLDVSSVLYSNRELLKEYDGLLKYYHWNLATRIKELGSDPGVYTYDVFMEEVRKYSFFGLAFSLEAACTELTSNDITNKVCEVSVPSLYHLPSRFQLGRGLDASGKRGGERALIHLSGASPRPYSDCLNLLFIQSRNLYKTFINLP